MTTQESKENLITQIVTAYASRPGVSIDEIAELTLKLSTSLSAGSDGVSTMEPARGGGQTLPSTPAIAIEKAVTHSQVFCLCCGKGFKMLKRHIGAEHGLTEAEYRAKFGLPADFPLVAPEYSERKANTAKKLGLGTYERKQAPVAG